MDKRSFNARLKILNTEKILAGAPKRLEARGEANIFFHFLIFNFALKDFLIHPTVKDGF